MENTITVLMIIALLVSYLWMVADWLYVGNSKNIIKYFKCGGIVPQTEKSELPEWKQPTTDISIRLTQGEVKSLIKYARNYNSQSDVMVRSRKELIKKLERSM